MSLTIKFSKNAPAKSDCLIVLAHQSNKKAALITDGMDEELAALTQKALAKEGSYKAASGETFVLPLPEHKTLSRLIILGVGDIEQMTAQTLQQAGGKLFPTLKGSKSKAPALFIPKDGLSKNIMAGDTGAQLAFGFALRSYSFDRYKSKKKTDDENTPSDLKTLTITSEASKDIENTYTELDAIKQGVFFARDFVNEAPNDLYPESYANALKNDLKPLGIDVEILDEKKMEKLGMGAIMAVGKGSERQPRMVIMRWNGAGKKKDDAPLALVGKGVTFDTGGISIKPGAGMDEMKMDMGGSAAVVGTMKTLALRKAKVNVVGVVGLAENMPSHNAYRPGDVITSYSGKTIEVLNTDAEGRLVLADCLTYVQQKYKPKFVINLATLTGAMMVALGHEYCGCFANDDDLWHDIDKAAKEADEKIWRMPLDPEWKKQMESSVADLQNLGKSGRWAGACTAAGFLEHFIEDGTPWAHMDIAGTAYIKADKPTVPKFGTGYGVRLLDRLIAKSYEQA